MTVPAPLRNAKGHPLKGQSLNPGGRPKGIEAVRALLEPHMEMFVRVLVDLANSPNGNVRYFV